MLHTRNRVRIGAAALVVAVGAGLFAANVIGDGVNRSPEPATMKPVATVPATAAQTARAGLPVAGVAAKKKKKKAKARRTVVVKVKPVTIQSRVTATTISTEEARGSFVPIRCPAGTRAISGGVISSYINLAISSSAPNHPLTGKYTPGTWWIAVTNNNVDGNGGTLTWRGVVNCLSPAKVRTAGKSGS